jgi:hypothetical protein
MGDESAETKFLDKRIDELEGTTSLSEIAHKIGFSNENIVSNAVRHTLRRLLV